MKKIMLLSMVIILMLSPSISQAGEPKDIYSVSNKVQHGSPFPNGRYWNNFLSEKERSTFIDGLMLGIDCLDRALSNADGIFDSTSEGYFKSQSLDFLNRTAEIKLTQEEMIKYIDNFYAQPLNLNIPINYAWSVMCLESNGKKVEDSVLKLREQYGAYIEKK